MPELVDGITGERLAAARRMRQLAEEIWRKYGKDGIAVAVRGGGWVRARSQEHLAELLRRHHGGRRRIDTWSDLSLGVK